MADKGLKAGDTVRLKSGGPLMTVKSIDGAYVITVWFEETKRKEGRFLPATLEPDHGAPVIVETVRPCRFIRQDR